MGTITASTAVGSLALIQAFVRDALRAVSAGTVIEVRATRTAADAFARLIGPATVTDADVTVEVTADQLRSVCAGVETWSTRNTLPVLVVPNDGGDPKRFTVSDPELIALAQANGGVLTADFLYSADTQAPHNAGWFGPRYPDGDPTPLHQAATPVDPEWDHMRQRLGSGLDLVWVKHPEAGLHGEPGLVQRFAVPLWRAGAGVAYFHDAGGKHVVVDGKWDVVFGAGDVSLSEFAGGSTNAVNPLTEVRAYDLPYSHARRNDMQWQLVGSPSRHDLIDGGDNIEVGGGKQGHFVLAVWAGAGVAAGTALVVEHDADAAVLNVWSLRRRTPDPPRGFNAPVPGMVPYSVSITGWDRIGVRAFHPMARHPQSVHVMVLDTAYASSSARLVAAIGVFAQCVGSTVDVFVPGSAELGDGPRHTARSIDDLAALKPAGGASAMVVAPTFVAFRRAVGRLADWGFRYTAFSPRVAEALPPIPTRRVPMPIMHRDGSVSQV